MADLSTPVFADSFSADLNGLLTPRMDLSAGVGYSTGQSTSVVNASTFDTYTASVRVRHALTRAWAVYAQYLYYFYDFGRAQVPIGVPSSMERNGVRVGITVWVPVIRR